MKLHTRLSFSFAGAVAAALLLFCAAAAFVLVQTERREARERGLPQETADAESREDLVQMLQAMLLAAPVAIGGAAGLGFWLARRALEPLREASARAVAARSAELDLTLPVGERGDEWDELAVTLNLLLSEARGSMARIRTFTADAAHELRTPLTAMIAEADLALRRDRSPEELKAALAAVREEALSLAKVVEALLTLSRADAKSLVSSTSPAALQDLAQEAAAQALKQAKTPGARVDVQPGAATVRCEPVLLQRALKNLIENGLTHGGGNVEVLIGAADGMGRVLVRDHGPGIDETLLPQLFQRFRRGDSSRGSDGLGLGLSLARALVEAQGGTVRALPAQVGAAFELLVPLAR
ncbi:MAG TPA: ATP-binding protein [Myxococcales bacterium]|nr:ATP-binding protein [Myxococcales bacterium]